MLSSTPSGVVSNAVSIVDFVFSSQLNPFTVDGADASLQVPPGALTVSNLSVFMLGDSTVRASFLPQTAPGEYALRVGPDIEDLFGQPMSQVYTGSFTLALPVIQGLVTNVNGEPVPGVVLVPGGAQSAAVTDSNGAFAVDFVPPATFTLTPVLPQYVFVPGSRSYSDLTDSLAGQHFLMVETLCTVSRLGSEGTNLAVSWSGIPGVTYQAWSSTNLMDWVPFGLPLAGTNGVMELLLPMEDKPVQFLRLGSSN